MGLREAINRHSKLTAIVIVVLVVGAAGAGIYRFTQEPGGPVSIRDSRAFFTADDGKTWFADAATQASPFQKDGKTAYRAYVWKAPNGKPFVSHLQRSAGAATAVPASVGASAGRQPPPGSAGNNEMEVKRPGDATWVRANTPAGEAIQLPRAPGGAEPIGYEPVEP